MKFKIMILTLVGLTAGVFGTVGSRILAGDSPATAAPGKPQVQVRTAAETPSSDACRGLARKLSHGAMSDGQLKRLLKKYGDCDAVVIDSQAPKVGGGTAPRIVTIPASTQSQVPPPMASQPAPSDDDVFEADDDSEEHEEEGGSHFEVEHEEDD